MTVVVAETSGRMDQAGILQFGLYTIFATHTILVWELGTLLSIFITTRLVTKHSLIPTLPPPATSLDQRAAALTCPIFSVSDESLSFTLLAVGQSDNTFRRPLVLGTVAGLTAIVVCNQSTSILPILIATLY